MSNSIIGYSGYAGERPTIVGRDLFHYQTGRVVGVIEKAWFVGRDAQSGLLDTDVQLRGSDRVYTLGPTYNIYRAVD